MQYKWLQILCLCAAIQFLYFVESSNGQPSNADPASNQNNARANTKMSTSEHNMGNGAPNNAENITPNPVEYETTVGTEHGGPPSEQGQHSTAVGGQTNTELGTNTTGSDRDGRQLGGYHRGTTPQIQRHICTKSTLHYDCQIRDVHLKKGQSAVFGLESNLEQKLTFQDSSLEFLPKSLIDAFPYVTLMNLNSLTIGSIEENAFQKAANLDTMYLEDNRLTNIDRNAFKGARKLRILVLSNNEITYFDFYAFDKNTHLQILNLDQNQLNALPALTKTVSLQFLNASHNNLASIDDRHFSNLRYLQNLDLSFNRLQQLNLQQLNANLDLVDVSFNELTEFTMPTRVTQLKARNNSLTEFVADPQCILRKIDLSWNALKNQPVLEACSSSLEQLDLSHNLLEAFQYRLWMANLQNLNLAHNILFEFDQPMKDRITRPFSLKMLDLSYNKLSHGPSLNVFKKLDAVRLNDNHLIQLKSYVSKTETPNFKGYLMANNEWNCADIPKFELLTYDKNKDLCTEKMHNVKGICCMDYIKPYNDRLNKVLREADFHERANAKKCPKPMSPVSNQNAFLEEIRNAMASANSVKANKLKEIEKAKIEATNFKTILGQLQNRRNRLNASKRDVALEIERQRQFHRVTKEGLISDQEMLERIVKFVQEKDAFNKDLLFRREKETKDSNFLFSDKQGETDDLKKIISNLQSTLAGFKLEEKTIKKEKEKLEKQVNRNAASIHGSSGRISYQ